MMAESNEPTPWVEETATQFRYDHLEDGAVRLLELEPSSVQEDPIRCKVIHVSRGEDHQYEILSCDWHDATKPRVPISLNGQTFDAPSEVWSALHRVRLEDRPRLLWIDAICINQRFDGKDVDTTDTEKNEQLSHLSDIYQNATGLLAWLGSAQDNSHLVFEHLDRCREHTHINWCEYKDETYEAYRMLSQRSWFYRVYSVQELVLSKNATILCGHHQSPWFDLTNCSSFLASGDHFHPLEGPDGRTHLQHLRNLSRNFGRYGQLKAVTLALKHCRADNPRDKIFAVVMMDTYTSYGIPIDYNQDISVLFQTFTQKAIESTQDLDILEWFGSQGHIDGLPSWVPDYTALNPAGTLPRLFGPSAIYSINYPMRIISGFEFQPGALTIYGRFVEKVEKVADTLEAKDTVAPGSKTFSSVLHGWENLASSLAKKKRFPQGIRDAFCDTLIGSDEYDLVVQSDKRPYVRKSRPLSSWTMTRFNLWYKQYGTGVLQAAGPTQTEDEPSAVKNRQDLGDQERRDLERYARQMEITCYGRKFFITDRGSMGLAPPGTRDGDDIVFFPGAKYPFIIRPKDNGTYELVGDCFLYDFDVFALYEDDMTRSPKYLLT